MRFNNMRSGAPGIFGNLAAYDPNALINGIRKKYQDDETEIARMEALGMQSMMPPAGPANAQDFAQKAMTNQITPEQYADPALFQNMEQAPEPAKKGKFFGEGGIGRLIAGAIGDALLTQAKMEPIYAPEMARRAAAQRDMDKEEKQTQSLLKVWAARNAVPENIELSDGTVVRVDQDGSATPVYQGQPKQTEFMQNTQYVDSLQKTNPALYRSIVSGDLQDRIPGIRSSKGTNASVKSAKPRSGTLKIGDIYDGKMYIGGNPSEETSWR